MIYVHTELFIFEEHGIFIHLHSEGVLAVSYTKDKWAAFGLLYFELYGVGGIILLSHLFAEASLGSKELE